MATRRRRKKSQWTGKKTLAVLLLVLVVLGGVFYMWISGLLGIKDTTVYNDGMPGVFFLDVGQADCILIKGLDGKKASVLK